MPQWQSTAPISENILKLHHLRHAVQSFYERRPAEQGLPAELLEFLRHSGAPAAPEDLQLFERILAEAQATAKTWDGRVSCSSICPRGNDIASLNWPARIATTCWGSPGG